MNKKKTDYLIKNSKTNNHVLTYNIKDNTFLLLNKNNEILNNDYINFFNITHKENNKYTISFNYKNKIKKIELIFVFSSNKLHNPLFFNMIINIDGKYKLLKSNCKHIICVSHILIEEEIQNINSIKFKNKSEYIFYLTHKTLIPCRIKIYNREYNVFGYNKTDIINNDKNNNEKNKTICIYNPELENSWKVDKLKECKYLKFEKGKYNTKMDKCSMTKNGKYLLNTIPTIPEVFNYYKKNVKKHSAGEAEKKKEITKNNIEKNLKNTLNTKEIEEKNTALKGLSTTYKLILGDTLSEFDNYMTKKSVKEKYTELDLAGKYIDVIDEIIERNKEYIIAKKNKVCTGKPIDYFCNTKNVVKCQNKCNENHDCAYISYNRINNLCKLFDKCNFKSKYEYDTYAKRSLLRNGGYNIYNSILLHRNPPIKRMSPYLRLCTFAMAIIIVIFTSIIIYRILKSIIRFGMCMYYDNCHYPTELLKFWTADFWNNGMPKKRYI
jgi:hypothetical protein